MSFVVALYQAIRTHLRTAQPSVQRGYLLVFVLVCINIAVGVLVVLAGARYPLLSGLALLAWGLGLRHAMDADHIAAIDNVTRRLLYRNSPSVAVGFFFSLGHSTIVLLLTMVVIGMTSHTIAEFDTLKTWGALVGGTVSTLFLLFIAVANTVVLTKLFKAWKDLRHGVANEYHGHLHIGGPIEKLFRPMLRVVDTSPKMYWIGLLFGLGFDTATEVGIMSISALATQTIPPLFVLLLPLAFMAGMTLLDTINSLFMLGIYTSSVLNPSMRLLYNIQITGVSIISALTIGLVVGLRILDGFMQFEHPVLQSVAHMSLDWVGYALVGVFFISWLGLLLLGRKYRETQPE